MFQRGCLIFVSLQHGKRAAPLHHWKVGKGHRLAVLGLGGGIAETQEMLDYCTENNISSDIELINIKDIHTAYERMLKGDVRYRFVIDMATL